MAMWLYQINQELWSPQRVRLELWEGERWSWPTRKFRTAERPDPGDTVVFYCAKFGGSDPGFYAWGVVTEFYEDADVLYFIPAAPTNYLKMTPWWNEEAERLADRIRGKMKQATLWRVEQWERDELRAGIRWWLGGTRRDHERSGS